MMSFGSAVPFFKKIKGDIDAGRLKDLGDVKNEVDNIISRLTSLANSANTGDEDQLTILLDNELQVLDEKRAKCKARLSRLEEVVANRPIAAEDPTASNSAAENIPRPTPAPSPIDPNATTEGVVPPASSFSLLPIATAVLRSAIIVFPGGPRTVTIHPPSSQDFKPVIQDEKGDTIIVFETVRGQRKTLRREGAFYGSIDAERAARAEVYGLGNIPRGAATATPASRHPGGQPSQQPQQQPSIGDTQAAQFAQVKTVPGQGKTLCREGAFYGSMDVERAARAEIYGREGIPEEAEHVPPAPRHPNGQSTNGPLETPASAADRRLPTTPSKSQPSGMIHDLNSARGLLSPSLGKRKGKQRALDEEDEEDEEKGAEEVKLLLTAATPTPPRTVRRANEPKSSLPPVRRSERVPKPVQREGSSRPVEKEKPGPAKRRRVG